MWRAQLLHNAVELAEWYGYKAIESFLAERMPKSAADAAGGGVGGGGGGSSAIPMIDEGAAIAVDTDSGKV